MTNCGYEKDDGEPCQLPASRDDGRCHHHTDIESERANGGRPSLLKEYEDDIYAGARQGMTLEGCARLAGVDESTLYRWIEKYEDFRKSLNRARAHGELQHLQSVNDSGSRFILERSFGYTKTEKREVENTGDEPLTELTIDFNDVDT
jgi:transposase-like protein